MWLWKAWPRLNPPEAVFLKRLAAPRLVFNLGMVLLLFRPTGGLDILRNTSGRERLFMAWKRFFYPANGRGERILGLTP
jgi:hypothetical protein